VTYQQGAVGSVRPLARLGASSAALGAGIAQYGRQQRLCCPIQSAVFVASLVRQSATRAGITSNSASINSASRRWADHECGMQPKSVLVPVFVLCTKNSNRISPGLTYCVANLKYCCQAVDQRLHALLHWCRSCRHCSTSSRRLQKLLQRGAVLMQQIRAAACQGIGQQLLSNEGNEWVL